MSNAPETPRYVQIKIGDHIFGGDGSSPGNPSMTYEEASLWVQENLQGIRADGLADYFFVPLVKVVASETSEE